MRLPVFTNKRQWLICLASFWLLASSAWAHDMATATVASHCQTPSPVCAQTVTLAADHQGHIWRLFDNGEHLYVQKRLKSDRFGKAKIVNAQPEAIANQGEQRLRLAFGKDDALYVLWTTPLKKHWTSNLRFARSTDGGRHFAKPITVNANRQLTSHMFANMTVLPDGKLFVVWLDTRDMLHQTEAEMGDAETSLFYNTSTDGGRHFQTADTRLHNHACICCQIALAQDDGRPQVFYRAVYPGSIRDHALIRFDANGKPLPALRISHDDWELHGCPEDGPAMQVYKGVTHLFWYDKGEVRYRRLVKGKLTPVQEVAGKGAHFVALAASQNLVARAWLVFEKGENRVKVQLSQDNGQHWQTAKTVATSQKRADRPQLVSNGQHVWLGWLTRDKGYVFKEVADD